MDKRLDMLVAEILGCSRDYAKEIICGGFCEVGGKIVYKAGIKFGENTNIVVHSPPPKFVSRGGHKLSAALDFFGIDLQGKICLDIGASTGGFTDCILQRGADRVYAVENGKNQLHPRLQSDPRVISMENTDIRELALELITPPDFVCCDLSFISLTKVAIKLAELMPIGCPAIVLLKPQFEAGRGAVNKHGILKDQSIRQKILENSIEMFKVHDLEHLGDMISPIKGKDGNIEHLLYLTKKDVS